MIKITHGFFCVPVQLDVKGNMLIQGICLLGIISHSIFRAHSHKFLGFVKFPALLSKAVETIFRADLAGMDPAAVAVFHVGQIYNICVELSTFLIIDTNAEGIFFHDYFQLFSLKHRLFFLICQNGLCHGDTLSVILHKFIHTVFPGGSNETVGLLCKVAVKSCTDTQDLVCKEPDAYGDTIGLNSKIRILLCYGNSL